MTVALALSVTRRRRPSMAMSRNLALWPMSKSMSGTTGTNTPKDGPSDTSSPGKVTMCPRLDMPMPERTSNETLEPPVSAVPEHEILPEGYFNKSQKERKRWSVSKFSIYNMRLNTHAHTLRTTISTAVT